jgi:hypothetical protein
MATRTKTVTEAPEEAPPREHNLSDEEAAGVVAEATRIFAEMDGVYTGGPDGRALGLYARLAKIMASLPEVKPEGRNDHFKYSFVTDKQVLGMVRPRLAQQMIMIYPETVTEQPYVEMTTQKGGRSMLTRLHVVFRVVDGLNGDTFTGEAIGYGDDSGDKGANKAYTAALKNFFIKLFLMGGADRDIEDDPETDRRARARESGVEPVQSVQVQETVVEGVRRGGRSDSATEAQVQAVSRLVASLGLTPARLAGAIEIILNRPDLEFKNFSAAKLFLESLSGEEIGRVIESLSNDEEAAVGDDAGPY